MPLSPARHGPRTAAESIACPQSRTGNKDTLPFIRGASRGAEELQVCSGGSTETGVPCAPGAQARGLPGGIRARRLRLRRAAPAAAPPAPARPRPRRRRRPAAPAGPQSAHRPLAPLTPSLAARQGAPPPARPSPARRAPGRRAQPAACWAAPRGGPGHGERARGGGRPGDRLAPASPRAAERVAAFRARRRAPERRPHLDNERARPGPAPAQPRGPRYRRAGRAPGSLSASQAIGTKLGPESAAEQQRLCGGERGFRTRGPRLCPQQISPKPTARGPLPPGRPRKRLPWLNLAEGSALLPRSSPVFLH